MKKILVISIMAALGVQVYAGNPDRKGESGAPELNMNGYARSAGVWNLNVAGIQGLESEKLNPAGLAFTRGTELIAAYTSWLTGAGVNIVQGGFATRVKSNAVALTINSLNFGAIDRTTTSLPEGGAGTFKPTYLNIGASYAKNFSLGATPKMGDNLITGGITLRLISEIVGNVTATGFGFDAGLQYTTGKKENLHFGVALRNVGTPMKFGGDALSADAALSTNYSTSVSKKTNKFELPTQLNLGISYDLWLGRKIELDGAQSGKFTQRYRLTFMGQYSANAFGLDDYGLGAEFSLQEIFMLRAAYRFENGIFKKENTGTAYNGFACGASVNIPFKKGKSTPAIAIDYGFRMTSLSTNFQHTHSVGLRISLGSGATPKDKIVSAPETPASAASYDQGGTAKRRGKKSKVTVEEVEEKDNAIDSLIKVNQALKLKAETPIVKVDTVIKTQVQIVKDTVLIAAVLEKTDYKGGAVDTVSRGGKSVLQFNDYEALEYETGSARIQTKSYAYLNYLINIMKKNPSYRVSFEGHTDNVGAEPANQKLSQDRVDAVKAYFVSKGISEGRIDTKAFGSTRPKYENSNAAGRAKNRRVEIYMEM
ncbi:MAG: PorV/PorQ family protein [Bacteroidetes bacterium]|nr:PorV/PorQ family protein [Bacteroidota bacterium]MBS1685938.1 PorV/PorQ family protein [Bacteroidota bacterium]